MRSHQFIKTGWEWFIDLPEYLEQGGTQGDLQMVEGADKMLDMMAGDADSVILSIAKDSFDNADLLVLTEKCDPYIGGGYYFMEYYEGKEVRRTMWLCQVTEFVFGGLPEKIFVRREN